MTNPFTHNPFRTRSDVAVAVRDLVAPLLAYFSEGSARVCLGKTGARHDDAAAELEAFARPLWGLAPLAAGGGDFAHWSMWREGLANGTDPDHPEYWGDLEDIEQRLVEMAAIGFALCLVPDRLWTPLSSDRQRNVAAYLQTAHRCTFANNNWKFFRILIGMGLRRLGLSVDSDLEKAYLNELDDFYLGGGWYRDGPAPDIDHYNAFAFHFYGLVYAAHHPDSSRAAAYRERATAFAGDIRHWYAPDGAALPFGRSLTYRFAHAAFWGALAYAGLEALPWSEIKGYYLRNLRWWAAKPIFDRDGILSIGFGYPNLLMSEDYNAPGSPYWAMKAFLPLALPDDHPFWTAEETVPEAFTKPVPLQKKGMVVQHLPGHHVALASGPSKSAMRHVAEKYAKFAYSTRYGFSVETDDRQFEVAAADNMLCLSKDGMHLRMRERNIETLIADNQLYARWRPFSDVEIETWLIPVNIWHLRIHQVNTPCMLETIEGGFAIAKPDYRAWQEVVLNASVEIKTASDVSAVFGFDHRLGFVHSPLPNTNLMAGRTLVPQLRGRLEPGRTRLACAVFAGPNEAGKPLPHPPEPPSINALRRLFRNQGRQAVVPCQPLTKIK